jgi:hypothetical protein
MTCSAPANGSPPPPASTPGHATRQHPPARKSPSSGINRIKGDITGLSPADRARIDEAVAVVRKHRAVSIGMPRLRPAARALPAETKGQAS